MDPIHQFVIKPIVGLHPFGIDASFTNASLFMVIIVLAVAALMAGIFLTSSIQILRRAWTEFRQSEADGEAKISQFRT